ncbi:MAG: penicillin-binding transpeptidase domain-containing protein [Thermoleophilia bacterium]
MDLPEEYPGRVPTPEWKKSYLGKIYPDEATWKGGDDINMAVGQGNLTVTPLQMAVAYSAIANGGTMLTPVVGRQVSDSTGQVVRHITPAMPPRKLDIPARLFDPVHQGLINVTQNGNGTANGVFSGIASAANIVVAGKTGTAENLPHKDHAWFVGYAPAEHPSVVVAIVVQNGGTGAVAAAPAVCRTIAAVPGTRFDPNLCGTPTQTVSN